MQDAKYTQFFGDVTPELAKDKRKHKELQNSIRRDLEKQVPYIIERLAETRSFLIPEGIEYSDLLVEASSAYSMGYWRSVIALIGVAGESFTDDIYHTIDYIISSENTRMTRQELFGEDTNIRERNKRAALLFCRKIEKPIYNKLCRIKTLRDSYVHPKKKAHDMHSDAKEALNTFIEIMDWYVDKVIGKIRPGMSIRMEKIK